MSRSPRILSVGQCSPDHSYISAWLRSVAGARTIAVDTKPEALEMLRVEAFDLVLVNRIGDCDGAPGIDLIRAIRGDAEFGKVPVMLVSNHASAQDEAIALGARPGFGKAEIGSAKALERLTTALALKEVVD
jgi:two-component system chemotaxis response regulator CheY